MNKDYIYIKIYNSNITKIILKDTNNKIIFTKIIDKLEKIKVPICNNNIYKLYIYSNQNKTIIPLIAKKNEIYCININTKKPSSHLVTILLTDKQNPNIKIERGEITLWENT